jgi:hypothetical protein
MFYHLNGEIWLLKPHAGICTLQYLAPQAVVNTVGGFPLTSETPKSSPHIKTTRMWSYARLKKDLSREQEAHMSSCKRCLKLFHLCVTANSVEEVKQQMDNSAA